MGDDLDRRLYHWQETVCNCRVHGTTRKVPDEVFITEEKEKLKALPVAAFSMPENSKRKVYHDCHIYVKYNYYSVPFEYVGKEVEIELTKNILKVYYKSNLVATHTRIKEIGKFSTIDSHYPKYKTYSETESQEKYQVKIAEVGPYAEQMFFAIVNRMPKVWERPVKGILSLLKKYPKDILEATGKRALAFNVSSYQTVKNICANGAYALPVEFNISKEVTSYEYA